jgi:hypothetical protein
MKRIALSSSSFKDCILSTSPVTHTVRSIIGLFSADMLFRSIGILALARKRQKSSPATRSRGRTPSPCHTRLPMQHAPRARAMMKAARQRHSEARFSTRLNRNCSSLSVSHQIQNDEYSFTFYQCAAFDYYCEVHPNQMFGRVCRVFISGI